MRFVSENPDKTWSISKVLIIIHLKAIFPRAAVWLEISVVIPHLVCSCESTPTTRPGSTTELGPPCLWCGGAVTIGPDLYMSVGLDETYESRHTVSAGYICIMKYSTIMKPSRSRSKTPIQELTWGVIMLMIHLAFFQTGSGSVKPKHW